VLRLLGIIQMTIRLTGVALIILGGLLWTGHIEVRQAHMGIGGLFVLALWLLAAVAFRMRVAAGLGVRVVVWGMVVLVLGLFQGQLLSDSATHVYIRILHLVAGLIAIGLAELLAGPIKRSHRALDPAT